MNQDEIILKLLDQLALTQGFYQNLKNYYDGFHDILTVDTNTDVNRSDERVYFNYPRKIVQNYTGYMLGKAISYTSKSGQHELIDVIDMYFTAWERKHNVELKQQGEIYGRVFEVSYINPDNEFQCTLYNPLEMVVLYDGTVNNHIKLAVRQYKKLFDDSTYVDVYDDVNVTFYKYSNGLEMIDQKPHYFDKCPVRELQNNDIRKSAFADIIKIVDVYNLVNSCAANEIVDFKNAYLKMTGVQELTPEKAVLMKKMGIIFAPEDSEVDWLIKKIDGTFIKDMLERWQDEIYIQTNTVNLNENFQSNTSGVSIRMKLQELENICSIKEAYYESLLKERLKAFCYWLKQFKNLDYDYRDIAISFTRNVPVDEESISNQIVNLQDIIPNEILLSWHPRITNPAAAMKQLDEERKSKTGIGLETMFNNDPNNPNPNNPNPNGGG